MENNFDAIDESIQNRLKDIAEFKAKEDEFLKTLSEEEQVKYIAETYRQSLKFAQKKGFNIIDGGKK